MVLSGYVTSVFGLFPVTLMLQTSQFRSDPANEHLINQLKFARLTAFMNRSVNTFISTYLIIVAAPPQEQLESISVIDTTFVF